MPTWRWCSAGLLLPQLSDLTLTDTLAHAVRDHERRCGATVATDVTDLPEQAPLPVKIAAYRVTQEALTNAWRHAGGAAQRLRAVSDGGELLLENSDAGPGPAGAARNGGGERLGLLGMRERVESLGGQFRIEAAPGGGTRVSARLPLTVRDEESEAARADD